MLNVKNKIDAFKRWVWDTDIREQGRLKRGFIRFLRIVILICKGFTKDECALHASSLTFVTLFSIIPVFAVCLSLAKIVGYGDLLRDETKRMVTNVVKTTPELNMTFIHLKDVNKEDVEEVSSIGDVEETQSVEVEANIEENVESNEDGGGVITLERIQELIDVGFDKVDGFNFEALGFVGFLILLWTVIGLLDKIETAFNRVWDSVRQKSILRKLITYLCVLVFIPGFCLFVALVQMLRIVGERFVSLQCLSAVVAFTEHSIFQYLFMLVLSTISFGVIHMVTPNYPVKLKYALVGGFFTSIFFSLWIKICLSMQIGVVKYSAVFGSFAIVPILLFWVYVSWQILLFGAEITYAIQNTGKNIKNNR